MSDGVNTLDTAAIRQQAEQALRAQPVRRILAVDGCPVQVIADPVYVMLDADHALTLLDALAAAETRAAALEAALRRLLGNIATGRPLHNGYSVYYDGHFPDDLIAQARAALADAAPATREE